MDGTVASMLLIELCIFTENGTVDSSLTKDISGKRLIWKFLDMVAFLEKVHSKRRNMSNSNDEKHEEKL